MTAEPLGDSVHRGGAWRYEVHDTRRCVDEDPVVRAGDHLSCDTARADGQAALLGARRAAIDEEGQRDTDAPSGVRR